MKKRALIPSLLFFLFCTSLFAQNNKEAEKIANNILSTIENKSIKTDFEFRIFDQDTEIQEQKGEFLMQKKRFYMQTDDMSLFYDGKTQWVYLSDDNEVNITEPDEEQLEETNPLFILNNYKNKCRYLFSTTEKSKNDHIIRMIPKDAGTEITEIVIAVNKSNNNPTSIEQKNRDGSRFFIRFNNFQKNIKTSDKDFVFDKSKYKNVFENDMR